jgi:hypothetical protein
LGFAARQTARMEREEGRGLRWEPAGLRGEQGEGGLRVRERVAMALLCWGCSRARDRMGFFRV